MCKIAKFALAVSLCLLVGFYTCQASSTIFLKWERPLQPWQVEGRWQTGAASLDVLLADYQVQRLRPAIQQALATDPRGLGRVLRLEIEHAEQQLALLAALRRLPGTEYAVEAPARRLYDPTGKNVGRGTEEVPGDPLYTDQWFYPVMQAPAAWDLTHSNASIVVAIVDNGTDWGHPDLTANIWSNPGESMGNGQDDEGNGFVDDIRGWDFYDGDNNPAPEIPAGESDPDYHGTHTAGLVAAMMNNSRGVVGMAPSCKLMPVRTGAGGSIVYGLEGITYAAHNGADIISLSWGGSGSNSFEQDVITDARLQGCLIVAAAGNESSSDPHYPAAYEGVLSVAATDPNDQKVWFSNWGSWVSVSAPGQAILSLIPDGYGTASGTSMSTPLVAGVAALVKAYHSGWSADQIFNQIISTVDDIEAKNTAYAGLLGSGRVNAYRAVAETAPGIQIADFTALELGGDGDGRVDPGEEAQLIVSLHNTGATTTNIQAALSSNSPYVQVTQGTWNFVQMSGGSTANNSANPFQISISAGASANSEVSLVVTVYSENFYSTALNLPLWVDPSFAEHDTGNVVFTITDFGAFGYQNYTHPNDPSGGQGFRFPPGGSNALYHGSVMAGVSTAKVSDCAYGGPYLPRYDWQATSDGELSIFPGLQADQEGTAAYQDLTVPLAERVGLKVTQRSYAWSGSPGDDFVILSFNFENISGTTLSNLYAALYMDWDIPYYGDNEANWDAARVLGYTYNQQVSAPNTRYYGISLLGTPAASYRVIDNVNDLPPGPFYPWMTDSLKYAFMSAGMVKAASSGISDHALLLSAGPFTLAPNDSVECAWAVLGGETLGDLQTNAETAISYWTTLTAGSGSQPLAEEAFRITGAFPQPANGDLNLSFHLPGPGEVSFELINPLGQAIPLAKEFYQQGGYYRMTLSSRDLASGIYFLRGQTNYGDSSAKILWLK